jgi:hypothetical protein
MFTFLKKTNSKIQEHIKQDISGFIPRKYVETNIPLTDYLYEKKDFLWECCKKFGRLEWKKINFRNHGDEKYLQITDDLQLFAGFFTPCEQNGKENWFEHVSSAQFCFVFKGIPIIQIDLFTPQGYKSITIGHSQTILHFIDNQQLICGQFGADDKPNDDKFYFMKYQNEFSNHKFQNNLFHPNELLVILKKCIDIMEDIWNTNQSELNRDFQQEKRELIDIKTKKYNEVLKDFLQKCVGEII